MLAHALVVRIVAAASPRNAPAAAAALAVFAAVASSAFLPPGPLASASKFAVESALLLIAWALLFVDLIAYAAVRQMIRLSEVLHDVCAGRGARSLRVRMGEAAELGGGSYRAWHEAARELDELEGRTRWQREEAGDGGSYDEDHPYNWSLIRKLSSDLRHARKDDDPIMGLAVLQECVKRNVGGILCETLYSFTNTGEPKDVVGDFLDLVLDSLGWLVDEATAGRDEPETEDTTGASAAAAAARRRDRSLARSLSYERCLSETVGRERLQLLRLAHAGAELLDDGEAGDDCEFVPVRRRRRSPSAPAPTPMPTPEEVSSTEGGDDDRGDGDGGAERGDGDKDEDGDRDGGHASSPPPPPPPTRTSSVPRRHTLHHRNKVTNFLRRARAAYGRTALCLSGGGMNGCYHFGHVRALLEADALPHIVSGTSAGSVVASFVCTRTDEEIVRDMTPDLISAKMAYFSSSWTDRIERRMKDGNLFDHERAYEVSEWFASGDLTFEEAYRKTGRVLCVSLSPTTTSSPPVLLNYISAPNVIVASAVVASSSIPGFLPAARLRVKDGDGKVSTQSELYVDGSIYQDIPRRAMSEMFNVHFFIVAQVNPNLVPFTFDPRGAVGRPVRGNRGDEVSARRGGALLAALERYVRADVFAKFRFLRYLGAQTSSFDQDFFGTTTIVPHLSVRSLVRILQLASPRDMRDYIQAGTLGGYRHCSMIRLHMLLPRALDECLERMEGRHTTERGTERPTGKT